MARRRLRAGCAKPKTLVQTPVDVSGDASGMAPTVHRLNSRPEHMAMSMEPTSGLNLRSPPQFVSDASQASIIGRSKQNRPIVRVRRGRAGAPLKVLILGGQHGDERAAGRTLQSLLAVPADEVAARLPSVQLAIVPEANPDGCAAPVTPLPGLPTVPATAPLT